jgi:hypothetical protein
MNSFICFRLSSSRSRTGSYMLHSIVVLLYSTYTLVPHNDSRAWSYSIPLCCSWLACLQHQRTVWYRKDNHTTSTFHLCPLPFATRSLRCTRHQSQVLTSQHVCTISTGPRSHHDLFWLIGAEPPTTTTRSAETWSCLGTIHSQPRQLG